MRITEKFFGYIFKEMSTKFSHILDFKCNFMRNIYDL